MKYEFIGFVKYILKLGERGFYFGLVYRHVPSINIGSKEPINLRARFLK